MGTFWRFFCSHFCGLSLKTKPNSQWVKKKIKIKICSHFCGLSLKDQTLQLMGTIKSFFYFFSVATFVVCYSRLNLINFFNFLAFCSHFCGLLLKMKTLWGLMGILNFLLLFFCSHFCGLLLKTKTLWVLMGILNFLLLFFCSHFCGLLLKTKTL